MFAKILPFLILKLCAGILTTSSPKETTITEALDKLEKQHGYNVSEEREVILYAQHPPIVKVDSALSRLIKCEKLSLSTNHIIKIENLDGLRNLKMLSLGGNNIKSLSGLDVVADTLEELWISYNHVESLEGIGVLKNLKVLYMTNNNVKYDKEVLKLSNLTMLRTLNLHGNPLEEKRTAEGTYRNFMAEILPNLKILDGVPIGRGEEEDDK